MTRIENLYNKIEKEYNRKNEISNIKNIGILAESDKILKSLLEINDVVDTKWKERHDNATQELQGDSTMSYYFFRPQTKEISNAELSPNAVASREEIQEEKEVYLDVFVNLCRSINLTQNIAKKLASNNKLEKPTNAIVQIDKIEDMLLDSILEYTEKRDASKFSYGYLKNKNGEEYLACDVPEFGTLYADINEKSQFKNRIKNVKYEFDYTSSTGVLLPGFSKENAWEKFSWGKTEAEVRSQINMPKERTEIEKIDDLNTRIIKTYNKKVLEMEVLKNLKDIVVEAVEEDYTNLTEENKEYIVNSDMHAIGVKLGFTKDQLMEINNYNSNNQ